jgi:DNA-binding transcriptional MerR regulator/methylmalonyl-CoA mutase cobalamin-binding subunit
MDVKHSIRVVALKTGLSAHVIRIWEKRYGAVQPRRTATRRRIYTESDLERLNLLRQATRAGHSIGNVARLEVEQLRRLAGQQRPPPLAGPGPAIGAAAAPAVAGCLTAIQRFDAQELEAALEQAALDFGQHGLLQNVVAPLTCAIGDHWRAGTVTAAQEHMATGVLRLLLGRISRPFAINGIAPLLLVGTPAGQLHELGAALVAAAAANLGWHVTFLGSSLPASEIAGAAIQKRARAVALSVVYPEDDPGLADELQHLRRWLPAATALIVGGRAAPAYRPALAAVGALVCSDLNDLYGHLDRLRQPAAAN